MPFREKPDLRLHILSIRAVEESTFAPEAGRYAVINCAERQNRALSVCPPDRLLALSFIDTESGNSPDAFSSEHGAAVRSFLLSLPESVTELFVFCDAGESRSPAVAAAILRAFGKSDDPVWENPFYHPNMLVYGRLCEALGVPLTEEQLTRKKLRSDSAYNRAIKRGATRERWEVIG